MKKRLLAMLLVLAMALSLLPPITVAVEATDPGAYYVGYSKVDINPYADGTGADQALMNLPMAGFNDDARRLALSSKLDDNGDGIVDENDGIFATCTAITDKNGKTALLFTADLLWGYNSNYGDAVLEALLGEEFAQYGLDESRIFFNGSHNHFAPTMADGSRDPHYAIYNTYLKDQFVKAAQQALADRAWADMYQGSMDVVDYFRDGNKQQLVGDLLNDMRAENRAASITEKSYETLVEGNDVFFTCVRHFIITEKKVEGVRFDVNGNPISGTGTLVKDAPEYTYYAGNGTNGDWVGIGHINTIYKHDPETGIIYDGTNGTKKDVEEYRQVINVEEATPTDDTLRVVEFRFGDNSNKKPVVMINWRGHLPSTSTMSEDAYNQVSGGMVNALRNAMDFKGYRASFLQGETGNTNMDFYGIEGHWMFSDATQKTNIFGTELAQLALNVLESAEKINEDGGEIRSVAQIYQGDMYRSSVFEYIAAARYLAEVKKNGGIEIGRRVYTDISYYEDENGQPLLDSDGLPITVDVEGEPIKSTEPITITSISRANTMKSNWTTGNVYTETMLNVLTIGKDFKLTSVAAEIFDHYIGENGKNLWDTLKEEHNDPFVLGVTNNFTGSGYMPNKAAYHYMHNDGDPNYTVGTYESIGTRFAEGYGEAVVNELDAMLDFLEEDHPEGQNIQGKCAHCDKDVTWIDLSREVSDGYLRYDRKFTAGHYYLPKGETVDLTKKNIPEGVEVCIDLNGQKLNIAQGLMVYGELSIVDSKGTGTVDGYEAYHEGGLFHIAATGEMNIYGGSFCYKGEPCPGQSSGGIVYVNGKFTMYGGEIQGTSVYLMGGAMVVQTTGKAFFRGGTIEGGSISVAGNGNCVTVYGEVTLSGDPNIASLFYIGQKDGQNLDAQKLNFDGVFTGTVAIGGLETADPEIGVASENADITTGNLSDTSHPNYQLQIEGGKVYKRLATDYVAQNAETKEFIYGSYTDLNTVLQTLPDGSRVVMLAKLPSNVSYNVEQDLQWELKGQSVDITINVAEGKTLRFTDCKGTGTVNLNKITGKVIFGEQPEDDGVVYIPIEDQNGNTTYHEARLNIDTMYLRAENQDENGKAEPGLYFGHRFDGDSVVKQQVKYYGIAFSLKGAPTAESLKAAATRLGDEDSVVYKNDDDNVVYTKIDGNNFGQVGEKATSTLITGIMKETNSTSTNAHNAQMPIFGVAYVELENGDVVLGAVGKRSLQTQVEKLDESWDQLSHDQRKGVLRMYKLPTIKSVVESWEVSNLTDPTKVEAPSEKEVFRVLSIGNSHTDDATEYLYDLFMEENPGKEVQIAQLYHSGCTVDKHVGFAAKDAMEYVYRTNEKRNLNNIPNSTLRQALSAEIWDVIILHEMNSDAGLESTYTGASRRNLQNHINYIKRYSLNGDPKLIWNFSWSNPTSQKLWGQGYPGDWVNIYIDANGPEVDKMYDDLLSKMKANTKQYVMTNGNIKDVAPTGLAFKYARDSVLNPNREDPDLLLYRDYTHAAEFGKLLASYVWYATLEGKTEITELKYTRTLPDDQKDLLLEALNYALENKYTLK